MSNLASLLVSDEILAGEKYTAKVSNKKVQVEIVGSHPAGGFSVRNLATGRVVHIKDAKSFSAPEVDGEEVMEDIKRTRTSPRTKAFNEVLALLATLESEDVGFLESLTAKVVSMRDTVPATKTDSGDDDEEGSEKGSNVSYIGRNFVGVNAAGEREWFAATKVPTKETHGEKYVSVFAFRRKEGAEYRVINGISEGDKQVF